MTTGERKARFSTHYVALMVGGKQYECTPVEADMSKAVPEYRPKYAILWDATPEEINSFHANNPGVFVFTCLTKVEHDYSGLVPSCYIVLPVVIGSNHDHEAKTTIAHQIVEKCLQIELSKLVEVVA